MTTPEKSDEVSTTPPWLDVASSPRGPLEAREVKTDVCVVGGGMAGLSAAYALACEGKRVIVLDRGPIGGGETSRTSAHLASYLDARFVRLEARFGEEIAALARESHAAAIDWIEATCARERIDCGFRRVDGYLFAGAGAAPDAIEEELAAMTRAGATGVELVSRAPFSAIDTGPAMRMPDQAQFHPLAFLSGLASAIEQRGGILATPHHVERIEERDGAVTIEATDGLRVIAGACIVATNAPLPDAVELSSDQTVHRTHAITVVVQDGTLPSALYWDTEEPYHYVRVIEGPDGSPTDLILVGGEDHPADEPADDEVRWARLEAWTRDKLGAFLEVAARWSGQIVEPNDGLATIGRARPGAESVFVVTGGSGNGLTHAALGAMLLTDLILGRENRWQPLYDPHRDEVSEDREEPASGERTTLKSAREVSSG